MSVSTVLLVASRSILIPNYILNISWAPFLLLFSLSLIWAFCLLFQWDHYSFLLIKIFEKFSKMSSFYIKNFLSLFIFFKLNLLSSFDIDVYSVYSVMFIHSSMTKELAFFNKIRLRCYNRFFFKNLFKYLFYFYLIIYTNNRTQNKNNSNNQTLQKELLSTIYILKSRRRNSDGKSFCLSILFSKGTSGI